MKEKNRSGITLKEYFDQRTEKTKTCWKWVGSIDKSNGYGVAYFKFKKYMAHRVSVYISGKGKIKSSGTNDVIDHLCRNRSCVNPGHLEIVSVRINTQRGSRANQTHCKRGHEFNSENTYRSKIGRACRICHKEYMRKWVQKNGT